MNFQRNSDTNLNFVMDDEGRVAMRGSEGKKGKCRGEGGERAGVVWMSNKSRPYYEMQLDY